MQLRDRVRLGLAVGVAKLVTGVVRSLRLGAASVLPGEISRRLHPHLLPLLFAQVSRGVILIVGTNGKTTTSLLLKNILEDSDYSVVHNASGANLINGLITALLSSTDVTGKLVADYAILEVDENILPLVLQDCHSYEGKDDSYSSQVKNLVVTTNLYILGLNLFRDQLDRYGEVDIIAQRWQGAIAPLPKTTTIILNADDPTLSYLGQQLSQAVVYFGLNEPELYLDEIPHAVDSIYCPSCGQLLNYQGVYLSHLGDYQCPKCDFKKSQTAVDSKEWSQILIGVYNKYNTLAAGLLAQQLGIDSNKIHHTIKNFKAAFGRAEELNINGKQVRILLSKNPVGMNETIRAVNEVKKAGKSSVTLLVLNDRIPDGTDVSWIWDVDTEELVKLGGKLIVSGDRVYDMALRLQYSYPEISESATDYELIVKEDLPQAITTALEQTPPNQTLHILPTYSAMLEVREILVGRKIL